jgi:CHAT domain-containing protein/Tfp pilus assembly protein PilF
LFLFTAIGCRGEKKSAPAAPACQGSPYLEIAVQPGEYVHVVADQESRDIALTLFDPRGRKVLKVDSLLAPRPYPYPAEEIHWIADAPGRLRIELTLSEGSARAPCNLRLAERRPATLADQRRTLAEIELARAHALRRSKKPEICRAGVAPYESAQSQFEALGLPQRQAEALFGLGQLYRDCLQDQQAALKALVRTERLSAGDQPLEATVRQLAGELRYALGDLDGAISEDRRALELRQRLGDHDREIVISNNLGHVLQLRGHYDEAATLFDQALALWKAGDDPIKRAKALINRGQLHRQLGEMEQARERFSAALAIFREMKDTNQEAVTLTALGAIALEAGKPGAALEPLQTALALRPSGSRGRAVTQNTLGAVYRQLGRPEDARRAYAEALQIFRDFHDPREQASSLGNLGRLEAATGHGAAALEDFDRALELFRTLADSPDIAWVLEGKALVLRRRGDLEAARGLMEEALSDVERHRFSPARYATRAGFFSTQQESYDFLIDLLMEMHRKQPAAGYDAAALEVAERSLARSLLDGLAAGTNLNRGANAPELLTRERKIQEAIDALVSRQTQLAEQADSAALRAVETDLARRWDELDQVRTDLRTGDPRYAALTQPPPWKTAGIQRQLLDRDTLLLEYRLGETRSFLWAVTPDSLVSFTLPGRAEIERVARPACEHLAHSRSRDELAADPQFARLSRLLLDPVAPLLAGKRLLVVGDGILQSVPFATLLEPGRAEPLVAHHEIVALPSASVLGELRRESAGRKTAPKTLWVLADPDFGGRFQGLPLTGKEAAAILELAPAPKRAILSRQASRGAVLSEALRDYRYLHFATHGSFATTDPGGGRLVLAQVDPHGRPVANGFLYLADIYELDLRADLVVLSACQSALGREVRGEGMMGMTRGFFYAGAERVLVSLWNVNDRVTVELMRHFYRGILVEKLSPAAALRKAQNAIRRQPDWRAPYYWAGFTLQGEWR